MDGITFLRHLMKAHPMPVIVLSSLTAAGTRTAVEALAAGAVEVLAKPGSAYTVGDMGAVLARTIKVAARARVGPVAADPPEGRPVPAHPAAGPAHSLAATTDKVIALGASTGGVQALTTVLTGLPPGAPGVLVVQHMPARFTASFADRLDGLCRWTSRRPRTATASSPAGC
jgi:two-component system chemotaxis response regulator CheB